MFDVVRIYSTLKFNINTKLMSEVDIIFSQSTISIGWKYRVYTKHIPIYILNVELAIRRQWLIMKREKKKEDTEECWNEILLSLTTGFMWIKITKYIHWWWISLWIIHHFYRRASCEFIQWCWNFLLTHALWTTFSPLLNHSIGWRGFFYHCCFFILHNPHRWRAIGAYTEGKEELQTTR